MGNSEVNLWELVLISHYVGFRDQLRLAGLTASAFPGSIFLFSHPLFWTLYSYNQRDASVDNEKEI